MHASVALAYTHVGFHYTTLRLQHMANNVYNLWQWLKNKVQGSYYQEYKEKHCHLSSIIREHWKLATRLPKPKMRRTKKIEMQDQQDHNKFQVFATTLAHTFE